MRRATYRGTITLRSYLNVSREIINQLKCIRKSIYSHVHFLPLPLLHSNLLVTCDSFKYSSPARSRHRPQYHHTLPPIDDNSFTTFSTGRPLCGWIFNIVVHSLAYSAVFITALFHSIILYFWLGGKRTRNSGGAEGWE